MIADSTLLSRLNMKPGERITIGEASFDVRAELKSEPDGLANGIRAGDPAFRKVFDDSGVGEIEGHLIEGRELHRVEADGAELHGLCHRVGDDGERQEIAGLEGREPHTAQIERASLPACPGADCILGRAHTARSEAIGLDRAAGIDALGRIIEVVSGKPYEVFLNERIFQPLGMKDTGFRVPEDKLARLATIYSAGADGKLAHVWPTVTADGHAEEVRKTIEGLA